MSESYEAPAGAADLIGRPNLQLLSSKQAERIHKASLKMLETAGVKVHLSEAVDLLAKAGAELGGASTVRIPRELVEAALKTVPRSIKVGNRRGDQAMVLEGGNSYYGTGPTIQYVYDIDTGARRPTDHDDIEKAARICDYLPNIDFVMPMGMTAGVDPAYRGMNPKVTDRYDFAAMLRNTTKPLLCSCWTVEGLADIYEMAVAVRGSEGSLRNNPLFILFRQPVSPLTHDAEPLRAVMYCADKGIPMCYASYPLMGATGPATLAGSFALSNAEFLSGLVVSQLRRPGAPVIYNGGCGPMDMKASTTPYNAPESFLGEMTGRAMAEFYGMPNYSYGGLTDSKLLDEQAGVEAALSLFQATLSGSTLIHDVGYMEMGMTASWELIVLGDEIIGHLKRIMAGIDLGEDQLALELIEKVGPGGHFLMEDHTLERYRDVWYPHAINREEYSVWFGRGAKALREVLRQKVRWILENHQPEQLPKDVEDSIVAVLKRASG
jgi:trimethylamine--corrinoid protein Co-methyltransferase